ncbi:putative FAD-linked oxidase [Gordonia effusa NBRC 100432]|uniref:Putative FAD-linked oxidase n=1 Tax=Gordonia effusa NBRC 100432 TaxID=1077974 RepID=H0QWQ6_9ACTN|nr:FAD-binding oxidoreductase [Gordonia effusa]GAB17257.1 putative FAD-linked oxidase [Gordonia effusa NBRC 100432]
MKWNAWGDPESAAPLSESVSTLIRGMLGVSGEPSAQVSAADVELTPSRLSAADVEAIAGIVGAQWISTADADRLPRAGGKSTLDLLRRRLAAQDAPDAVALPADGDVVGQLLQWCSANRVAVVPFGGGTSVVGGLDPLAGDLRAVLSVDLCRLDSLIALDEVSGIATFGAGVTGPAAEAALAERGFSLGHFPQSFRFATIGGFAVTRSSGQASAGYGRFDDMVVELTLVSPSGVLTVGRAQKSAAGPDLRQLIMGSEGTFGIVTQVSVRVHSVPETTGYEAWRFDSFDAGADAFRKLAQEGVMPTVLRLSDEAETALNLARPSEIGEQQADDALPSGGCLAITTFEGSPAAVAARMTVAREIFAAAGGLSGGEMPARTWEHGRFNAPYLRDALLDIGVGCETLETATVWSKVDDVKAAVTTALTASLPEPTVVMCHISHTYAAGASLYFTVVYRQEGDAIAQWSAAKKAVSQAIIDAGASITHHHAIGVDHKPWLAQEDGELGVAALAAVKRVFDPAGVCNPGKLI